MSNEQIIITEHDRQDVLVPVITYIEGLEKREAVDAGLEFMIMCYRDHKDMLRLSDESFLTVLDGAYCQELLNNVIESYVKVEQISDAIKSKLIETAFKMIKGLNGTSLQFIKERFLTICGQYSYDTYWKVFESASSVEEIFDLKRISECALYYRYFVDFCVFIVCLVLVCFRQDGLIEYLDVLLNNLKIKYGENVPSEALSVCLWSLDFSFVCPMAGVKNSNKNNEYLALLNAVRSINPDATVQVNTSDRVWVRDMIGWVDDDYRFYLNADGGDILSKAGNGLLKEGGNIITGTCKSKFILTSQDPLSDSMTEVIFYQEMDSRDIRVYTLPDGFIWSRNPINEKDVLLDSAHIDTVINVIPLQCTNDDNVRVIIDPCYYSLIKDHPEFLRFIKEQAIPESSIIVIDERERYLNLANFSVILDRQGEKHLLINKDKGYTLPRLNLKEKLVVQPSIEIINMASSFGTIRCATNMLPKSLTKQSVMPEVTVSGVHDKLLCNEITNFFCNDTTITPLMSKLWVRNVYVTAVSGKCDWEFDESFRILYINIKTDMAQHASLNQQLNTIIYKFVDEESLRLGMNCPPQRAGAPVVSY